MSDYNKDEAKQTQEDTKTSVSNGSVHINIDKEKEAQAASHYTPVTLKHDHEPGRFAIEEHQRNDAKHPRKENTNTVPVLVRRIDSVEVLPRPFKTTTQLIIFSFLSVIFCLPLGAFAAKYAMKAKIQRNKGIYTVATRSAKRACRLATAAFICGILFVTLVLGIAFGTGGGD